MRQKQFTVGVTVLAHREPEQLARLLAVLRHPRLRIYLHIDSKAGLAPFRAALAEAAVGDVEWLKRRRTRWGGVELVDVTLDAMAHAMRDGCECFTLISGLDFPLQPAASIVAFFADNRGRTFLDHTPLPSDRYPLGGRERTDFYTYTILGRRETCLPRGEPTDQLSARGQLLNATLRLRSALRPARQFPSYLKPFGGELWVNLNHDATTFTLDFVAAHPDYYRYHRYTLIPDELFVQSILAGSSFSQSHELVNDDLRYISWPEPRASQSHPRNLTVGDLPTMLESNDIFARKVNVRNDPELVAKLEARIHDGD